MSEKEERKIKRGKVIQREIGKDIESETEAQQRERRGDTGRGKERKGDMGERWRYSQRDERDRETERKAVRDTEKERERKTERGGRERHRQRQRETKR